MTSGFDDEKSIDSILMLHSRNIEAYEEVYRAATETLSRSRRVEMKEETEVASDSEPQEEESQWRQK